MFLLEPPRTPYDVNFTLAGVPVRVHPLFWLTTVLLAGSWEPKYAFMWVCVVFISILVHELGHAAMIRFYGWRPRVTLYGFGGLAAYEPTWHRTWPQIAISFAGPAAGFLLAAVLVMAIRFAGHDTLLVTQDPFPVPIAFEPFASKTLNIFIFDMFFVNIFWGLINLLPIYPLDGGKIAQELLRRFNPTNGVRQSLMLSIFTAAGMAVVMYVKFDEPYATVFFAIFAAINYFALQQYDDRSGGRGW